MNYKGKLLVGILVIVMVVGIVFHLIGEENDAKSEFCDNFTPEVKWEVDQIGNNSALLHLVTELPPDKNNLKAEVKSIEDSFSYGRGSNLYLGTYENLSFAQCDGGLENYLIVPSGERLTVKVGLRIIVDESKSWWIANIESVTIEAIT